MKDRNNIQTPITKIEQESRADTTKEKEKIKLVPLILNSQQDLGTDFHLYSKTLIKENREVIVRVVSFDDSWNQNFQSLQDQQEISYHDLKPVICDFGGIHEVETIPSDESDSQNLDEGFWIILIFDRVLHE